MSTPGMLPTTRTALSLSDDSDLTDRQPRLDDVSHDFAFLVLCFLTASTHSKAWREENSVFIRHNGGAFQVLIGQA